MATLGRPGTTTRQTRTSGPVQPALSGTVGSELWTVASAPGADGKVCQTVVVRPAQPGATIGRGETEPNSQPTCAAPPGPRTDPVEGLQYRELPDASLVTGLVRTDVKTLRFTSNGISHEALVSAGNFAVVLPVDARSVVVDVSGESFHAKCSMSDPVEVVISC